MNRNILLKKLNYPAEWEKYELLDEQLISIQLDEYIKEYGSETPKGGTEHFRFGAFLFWLQKDINFKVLSSLLKVAMLDPDKPMAGAVIKEILAHKLSDESLLNKATEKVSSSKYYYATKNELEECFRSKVVVSKN
jgi:hypothetical protein